MKKLLLILMLFTGPAWADGYDKYLGDTGDALEAIGDLTAHNAELYFKENKPVLYKHIRDTLDTYYLKDIAAIVAIVEDRKVTMSHGNFEISYDYDDEEVYLTYKVRF